jgi:hypothetical protein
VSGTDEEGDGEDEGVAAVRASAASYRASEQYRDHRARGLCTMHFGRRGDGTWTMCSKPSGHIFTDGFPPKCVP